MHQKTTGSARRIARAVGFGAVALAASATTAGIVGATNASADTPTLTGYQIVTGAATAIPANSSGTSQVADAFCPNGKVVLSGGVVNHNSADYIRTSYPTDSKTWQVVVTPTTNTSYPETFQTYAVCVDAASVPGYHLVQTAQLPVGPATYYGPNLAAGDAYCSAGEVVLGGGVRSHNPSTFLTVSRPTSDQRAWEVEVHLTNPPSWGGEYYQVSAVCAPSADVSGYSINTATSTTYGTALTPAAPSSSAGTPYCANGTLAVAGGATNHDQQNGFISSVSPNSSGKYWVVTDRDDATPTYGDHFYPTSICVNATT